MKFLFYRYISIFILICTYYQPQRVQACECGSPVLQVGWYTAKQGRSQHINISDLIGDDFSVNKSSGQNVLVGLGYYFHGFDIPQTSILYGLNAFYLAPTKVKGDVTQEDLYTNLSYQYSITNYPIYFSAKALVHIFDDYDFTIDLGLGPNIISTHGFKEQSLDGITIPDTNIFSGKTVATFSASAGVGLSIPNVLGRFSLELNYRFFYLGQGKLKQINSQLLNTIRTGNSYANAIFVTISL